MSDKPCDDKKLGFKLPCHDYGNQLCYGHNLWAGDKDASAKDTKYDPVCPYKDSVERYMAGREVISKMGR